MSNNMGTEHFHINVPVKEIIKYNAVTVSAETRIDKVAEKMCKIGTGSCIVLQNNVPKGIVTEEDLTCKIVARNKKPSEVFVSEIMTTPLITIDADTTVDEAAHIMVSRKVRRLPVVDKQKVIGLVTIRDILPVTSELNEIMSELLKFHSGEESHDHPGVCDSCGTMSDDLQAVDGVMLCRKCSHRDDTD